MVSDQSAPTSTTNETLLISVFLLAAFALLAACSPSAPGPATSSAASGNKDSNPTAASSPVGNVCDRQLLKNEDLVGIVNAPLTGTRPLQGDPQSCYFVTATQTEGGPEILVSLRSSGGRGTIQAWLSGRMGTTATSIDGVGEGAVWVPDLNELDAQRNDVLCVVGLAGSAFMDHGTELQKKFGAVCNKLLGSP